jgi:hypothetical protein
MKYWNIDKKGVTITFNEDQAAMLKFFLPSLQKKDFYEGWINQSNPSPNKVGFYFDHRTNDETFCPNFHDLPYYYKGDYKGYMKIIVNHLQAKGLSNWEGHCSPLPWQALNDFIEYLGTAPL